jgi:lipopolysaccharide/colanic/teichoic acid biosynthesis glycosyltransferase
MSNSLTYLHDYFREQSLMRDSSRNKSSHRSPTCSASDTSMSTSNYILKWRQRKLIVQFLPEEPPVPLPFLDQQQWLVDRLRNSSVKLIKLDLDLGEPSLQSWAEAGQKTARKTFLRVPAVPQRPQKKQPLSWWLKRGLDWMVAAILLGVLSPAMLGLMLLLRLESPKPIFVRQWCVGERGRLFQSLKFRTAIVNPPSLPAQSTARRQSLASSSLAQNPVHLQGVGRSLHKLRLDRLPLLLNVLQGEMSLVGSYPYALGDAVQLDRDSQHCLNALPGIVGIRPLKKRSTLEDLNSTHQCDLDYLQGWSLWWDFKFLLMTIPKLILTMSA